MNYSLALSLKQAGLEQIGGGGWYCDNCEELALLKVDGCHCDNCDAFIAIGKNIVAIPDLAQLVEALESLASYRIEYCKRYEEDNHGPYYLIWQFDPFRGKDIKEKDLSTALSHLYLELKGGK